MDILFQNRKLSLYSYILLLLSLTAIAVNYYFFKYPGNSYFPPNATKTIILLLAIYSSVHFSLGKNYWLTLRLREIIKFFAVMSLIAIATIAAQYTPFSPIDHHIIEFENHFGISLLSALNWAHKSQLRSNLLEMAYESLAYQMAFIPMLFIIKESNNARLQNFYQALILSAIIGFTIYYFFPTTAPANNLDSPWFSYAQKATGIKFLQIRHHLDPTTNLGGLVALPSFHTIWAWLCTYLIYPYKILFYFMVMINLLLTVACISLGWHYYSDIAASIVILFIFYFYFKSRNFEIKN